MEPVEASSEYTKPKRLYKQLYLQVLTAIVIGVMLGYFFPSVGISLFHPGTGINADAATLDSYDHREKDDFEEPRHATG